MKVKSVCLLILLLPFCITAPAQEGGSSAQDGRGQGIQVPAPPRVPVPPVFPVGPERPDLQNSEPQRPGVPGSLAAGTDGSQRAGIVENRLLAAAEVFPNGDRHNSVADSVSGIFYTAYSDQSRSFAVAFTNGPVYTYLFRNPRGTLQMGPNEWRTVYDVIIQAGTEIISGFFTGEVYYNNGKPVSLMIINSTSASAVVIINMQES